jgi:hypothetical protein
VAVAVEMDRDAVEALRLNRPSWSVVKNGGAPKPVEAVSSEEPPRRSLTVGPLHRTLSVGSPDAWFEYT